MICLLASSTEADQVLVAVVGDGVVDALARAQVHGADTVAVPARVERAVRVEAHDRDLAIRGVRVSAC